ncbi:M48 family metalloprotease [bacterium]|nr:MAG: M48 family metalloprotease [bacterium]
MKKNYLLTLLFFLTAFFVTHARAEEEIFHNLMAQEIANLKEHDAHFKKEYQLKNDMLRSLLLDVRTMAFINDKQDAIDQITNYLLFKVFPGPALNLVFHKGLVAVNATQAPLLHELIGTLAQKMNITKPAIFITRDKSIFNACASSLAPNASLIIIGQKLLNTLSESELRSVLAHELAHVKNNHIPKQLGCSLGILTGSIILWRYLFCDEKKSFTEEALKSTADHSGTMLKSLAFLGAIIGVELLMLNLSRTFEEEADTDAIKITNDPQSFIDMISKLEDEVEQEFENYQEEWDYVIEEIKKIKESSSWHAWLYQNRAFVGLNLMKASRDQALKEDGGTHPSWKTRKEYAQRLLQTEQKDYSVTDSLS